MSFVAIGFRFECPYESTSLVVEESAVPVVEDYTLVLPVDFSLGRVLGGFARGGEVEE